MNWWWRRSMQEDMQSLHENNTYELVEWRIAMQEEMKSLHENNTYELVEWRRAIDVWNLLEPYEKESVEGREAEGKLVEKRQRRSKRIGKDKSDRISELPDSVLLHIIEFMDTKSGVQTCVLSKRWKDLWKSLTNLSFDYSYFRRISYFKKFVSQILSTRDHSISLLNLDIRLHRSSQSFLKRVMKYVELHNTQQLTIHIALSILNLNLYHPYKKPYKIVLSTPNLNFLTIIGHGGHHISSTCNHLFLEEVNIRGKSPALLRWLQHFANTKKLTLSVSTIESILPALSNPNLVETQPPCFARLESLKVIMVDTSMISNEAVNRMVQYLLQYSPLTRVVVTKG
ncbi:hypothetical protein D0Y65_024132 [Glycine soja]|uniref:F-box domain-containing protein n=1 Tax=Glycine soja TaxID=3848 RepID=A0A445J0S2_GLYSO|nr:hypothetical protein D0Y65_024132 [Glycine soja]